ncbi:kinase-like protein [Lentinus brumalis]|uniref:Kinase-like protein n=1 Tax=Lentinus brumalis TaxID=2498619 RepID=A0A371DVA1_9APHY|nr:kinase-like protein [Polyporus brumalis]
MPAVARRPRPFSTAEFPVLDPSQPIEEERWPWYDPKDYYPVRIGDVFQSRYQVTGKLGYGGYSTVWLCRDLVDRGHVALKVCTRNAVPVKRELAALQYLDNLPESTHVGRYFIRTMLGHFELVLPPMDREPLQVFQCLVLQPMTTSVWAYRMRHLEERLAKEMVKAIVRHVLRALHYLHDEAKVIHADVQEKNILFALDETSALQAFEDRERTDPVARKVVGDRVIYLSREIEPRTLGRPTLCDFGEARFGRTTYTGLIQPHQYRAPEVIFGMPWNEKVDIWSVGVMIWNMLEGRNMFKITGGPEKKPHNLYLLAHMVSLLGPPPVDFLKRSETDEPWKYFDAQGKSFVCCTPRRHICADWHATGQWIGAKKLPNDSFELSEENLEGEEKAPFLDFVRKMVTWRPEDRPTAQELLEHPWLDMSAES